MPLAWTSSDAVAVAHIDYYPESDPDGRTVYAYRLTLTDPTGAGPETVAEGHDLRSGADGAGLAAGLASLASFLTAWTEARQYPGSENRDLFPETAGTWADHYADELAADVDDQR